MIISSWLLLFLFFLLALLLFECLLCARSFAEHFYDSISFNSHNNPKVVTIKVNSLSSPFVWGHKYGARTWIQTQVWLDQSSCSCSLHNWYLAYHYSEGERWFFPACLLTLALRYRNEDLESEFGDKTIMWKGITSHGFHWPWIWPPYWCGSLWCNWALFTFRRTRENPLTLESHTAMLFFSPHYQLEL